MKRLLLLSFIMVIISSCEKSTSGIRFPEDFYYIVTGKLYEGELLTIDKAINVSRTLPYESGDLIRTFVDCADVKIVYTNNMGERQEWPLSFGLMLPDTSTAGDILHGGYYDTTGTFVPQKNKKYKLEISIPPLDGKDSTFIWAETFVPKRLELRRDSDAFSYNLDTVPNLIYESATREHPIVMGAESSLPVTLYFDFYCVEEYYEARRIHRFLDQGQFPDSKRDYEDPMTGEPRRIEHINTYQPEILPGFPADAKFIVDRGYKINIWFYGRYRIRIFSIDKNMENYKTAETVPYMYGGINNAYGYFGSVSGFTIYTNIIE